MQKQQHIVINQTCENNCPKPNLSAASFMKLRGVHVNSRVLIAHGCSCVFFIFFGCHLFSLRSGFPCPKRKIKVFFREVRARFLGIKWLPPGARTQPKKQVQTVADLVGGFLSHALLFGCKTCALVTRLKSLSSWSAWTRWLFAVFLR